MCGREPRPLASARFSTAHRYPHAMFLKAQSEGWPSAGITIATSIVSALTRTPVRCDVAMPVKYAPRKVLPIGGHEGKVAGCARVGIRTVSSKDNEKDLAESRRRFS